jgi:hypothetical protein
MKIVLCFHSDNVSGPSQIRPQIKRTIHNGLSLNSSSVHQSRIPSILILFSFENAYFSMRFAYRPDALKRYADRFHQKLETSENVSQSGDAFVWTGKNW